MLIIFYLEKYNLIMKLIKLYFKPGNRSIKSYIFKLKKKVSHLVFGLPFNTLTPVLLVSVK